MSVWLQRIMAAGAFPTQSELIEFPDPVDAALLNDLCACRCVEFVEALEGRSPAGGWRLTAHGLAAVRVSSAISVGAPILEPRSTLPLEDLTEYEKFTFFVGLRLAVAALAKDRCPAGADPATQFERHGWWRPTYVLH